LLSVREDGIRRNLLPQLKASPQTAKKKTSTRQIYHFIVVIAYKIIAYVL